MIKADLSKMHNFDIVLVSGLPCSGKSYIARTEFMDKGRLRISKSEIRQFVYEMTNFGKKWSEQLFSSVNEHFVKHTERKMVEHLLANGEKVLVIKSSLTLDSRKVYTSIAEKMRKTIGIIFIDANLQGCMERNRVSEDPIPENILPRLATRKTLPEKREGFNSIIILTDNDFDFD